jgi:hypothetical protein
VKVNPFSGQSEYRFRSFVTGLSIVTGLGTDDALQSLFIYTDPTAIGLAGREFVTKVPLCEDMDGEVVTIVSNPPPGAPGATGNTGATAGNGAQGIFANVPLPGAGTNAPVGAGGLLFVGGGVGAGTTPTTGANATTTLPAVTPAAATTTIPAAANAATGAGPASGTTTNAPVTLSVPPAFTTPGANALTGIGILAIGGIPTGFPASGILTGPGFTVKLVPNPGG